MSDLESLVASTIAVFKPYEKQMPSLDPKYFHRPPIKFLALTVSALNKRTGFAGSLFTDEQLKGNLPERDDKLNFFNDLKKYTEILIGQAIDVDSKQIAAGKDVEKTLVLMQSMVRAAENPILPFDAALSQVRGGAAPAASASAAPAAKSKPPPKPKDGAAAADGDSGKPAAKKPTDGTPEKPTSKRAAKPAESPAEGGDAAKAAEPAKKPPAKKAAAKPADAASAEVGDAAKAAEPAKKPPAKKAAAKPADAPADAVEGGDAAKATEPAKKPPAKKAAAKPADAPADAAEGGDAAKATEPAKKPPAKKAAAKPADTPADAAEGGDAAKAAEAVKKTPAKKSPAKPAEAADAAEAAEPAKKPPAKKAPAKTGDDADNAEGGDAAKAAEPAKKPPAKKTKPADPPADAIQPSTDTESPKPKPKAKAKAAKVEEVVDGTTVITSSKSRKPPPKKDPVVVDTIVPAVIAEAVDDEVDDIFVEEDGRGAHVADGENGKLVKEILAAARQMGPDQDKPDYMGDIDRFKQGIELAKGLLQHLAASAQPLDRLIQFSQEDLGNMENEYKRWTSECEKQQRALEAEKLQTDQQLQELKGKLDELNKDIERQETRLRIVKAAAFLKEVDLMKQFTSFCT
jgi:hypothetical protein